jgi:DNA polymerase III sliding clamp (beta) subunit (PCNA family)
MRTKPPQTLSQEPEPEPAEPDLVVSFDLPEFRVAFGTVARAVPKNSPRPVLMMVRLDLTAGAAVFTATNLEVWIRHQIASSYQGAAATVLLARATFAEILRVGGGDELTLAVTGDSVRVTVGRRSWKLPTADPGAFPTCPAPALTAYHEVDGGELA